MKRIILLALTLSLLCGCTSGGQVMDGDGMVNSYTQITQEQAQQMMAAEEDYVIVDVRRQDEYDAGHIPGAILIPNETIGDTPPEQLRTVTSASEEDRLNRMAEPARVYILQSDIEAAGRAAKVQVDESTF
jgi:rhodanese-related sulfurtransferase